VRVVAGLALVAACSFRTNGGAIAPDGSAPDAAHHADAAADADAMIDARMVDAAPMIDAPPQCPNGYATVAGAPPTSRYRLFSYNSQFDDHTSMWSQAKQTCENDGTHLIIVETDAEAIAIGQALRYAPQSPFYWEGITDQGHENMWKTVLGGDATYLPWAPQQPNGGTSSNCALFGTDGQLSDYACNAVEPFACECD
jgi:hypothetical protein